MGAKDAAPRRSTVHVLFLQAAIRIKYFIQSFFLLNPIFNSALSAYPSFLRPKGIPEIDYGTLFALRMIWLFGAFCRVHKIIAFICIKTRILHALNWAYLKLHERIAKKMEASGVDWKRVREQQIPEYDWKNGSPEEFYETYVRKPHPVVLRGFLKDSKVMDFTFDNIIKRFGDENVLLTNKDKDGYFGKLREVNDPKVYLHNSELLFNKYPEILDTLDTARLNNYLKKKCSHSQLFVGREGTGTPFHSAGTFNFFMMIEGSKRWYFIDPYDHYLAFPLWVHGNVANPFLTLYPDDYDESVCPTFKYCPYYTTEINGGDVLLNPPWWAHAIRNTGPKTVGVANRWLTEGEVAYNWTTTEEDYDIHRFASFSFLTGYLSFKFLQGILYEPSPKFDDHTTLREKNGRFTDVQRLAAKGEINIDGWRPIF